MRLAIAICVVALLACGARVFLKVAPIGARYANAEKYTAGGAELDGPVKNLDIDWTDGSVSIAYHAKNTVGISETAPKAISGDEAMRWWLDGDTLRIRYAKSGSFSLLGLFSSRGQNKALTVTLPEGLALGDVDIDVTSGDVSVPQLRADSVKIDLTSGDLALRQSGVSERVELSSTSGDITADVAEVGRLDVSITSGRIRTTMGSGDEVSLSTTSGDISLDGGSANRTRIDSTSGKIDVALAEFDDLQIEATSGDIAVALPSRPGYRADIDTTSGSFDSTVALAREGRSYSCGDGSAGVRIDTTSGNVRLTDVNGRNGQ
uniref:DUF4097 domain-containing protein n=1 Tax=uncultured bacterium Contig575 TaxID=1393592 RepID=W0FN02_9BACT|nr:hypothetical protein [uncultured bacterium Contig575]